MPTISRDRDAEKLGVRAWDDIAAAWAEHIPNFEGEISWPELEVEELQQLRPFYDELRDTKKGELQELEEIGFLYLEVFMSSLASARRAVHILRATAKHSETGFRSWSRTSAYQSAFFAMQSVIRLLGAVILYDDSHNLTFQFDLWSDRRKKALSATDAFIPAGFFRTKGVLTHVDLWSIFVRLLRATRMPAEVWPHPIVNRIRELSGRDFPSLRNRLNYQASFWLFDDLSALMPPEDLRQICEHAAKEAWPESPDNGNFPVYLGVQATGMAIALLQSVTPEGLIKDTLNSWSGELSGIDISPNAALGIA